MKRPNFERIICTKDASEVSDSKPIETFVPHQSFTLSEIMSRFEKGQRLPARPLFDLEQEFTKGEVYMEDFEDAPPDDVRDVVDVQDHYMEHQEHKKDYSERQKKKKGKDEPQSKGKDEPSSPTPPTDEPAGE